MACGKSGVSPSAGGEDEYRADDILSCSGCAGDVDSFIIRYICSVTAPDRRICKACLNNRHRDCSSLKCACFDCNKGFVDERKSSGRRIKEVKPK